MGGNALAHVGATRVTKSEYLGYLEEIKDILPVGFREIPYVREKDSFGDMDIIVDSSAITINELRTFLDGGWLRVESGDSKLEDDLIGMPYSVNGNVLSFLLDGKLQVDAIFMPSHVVDFSVDYFSYNDLGNLMGRIAHKMGMKFGHDGLWIPVRNGTHKAGEILATRDFDAAIELLGYDPVKFREGFDTFEEMFLYASSTKYFSPAIYDLDNRNHTARVRDRKRTSYMNFLKWVDENNTRLHDFPWNEHPKHVMLERVFTHFPNAKVEYDGVMETIRMTQQAKKKFPTSEIMSLTGLEGKNLGAFKRYLTENLPDKYAKYHEWILDNPVESLRSYTLKEFDAFRKLGIA